MLSARHCLSLCVATCFDHTVWHHAASSGNFPSTFRDNLYDPSSNVKKSQYKRRCVISQKTADLISNAAEASNHKHNSA